MPTHFEALFRQGAPSAEQKTNQVRLTRINEAQQEARIAHTDRESITATEAPKRVSLFDRLKIAISGKTEIRPTGAITTSETAPTSESPSTPETPQTRENVPQLPEIVSQFLTLVKEQDGLRDTAKEGKKMLAALLAANISESSYQTKAGLLKYQEAQRVIAQYATEDDKSGMSVVAGKVYAGEKAEATLSNMDIDGALIPERDQRLPERWEVAHQQAELLREALKSKVSEFTTFLATSPGPTEIKKQLAELTQAARAAEVATYTAKNLFALTTETAAKFAKDSQPEETKKTVESYASSQLDLVNGHSLEEIDKQFFTSEAIEKAFLLYVDSIDSKHKLPPELQDQLAQELGIVITPVGDKKEYSLAKNSLYRSLVINRETISQLDSLIKSEMADTSHNYAIAVVKALHDKIRVEALQPRLQAEFDRIVTKFRTENEKYKDRQIMRVGTKFQETAVEFRKADRRKKFWDGVMTAVQRMVGGNTEELARRMAELQEESKQLKELLGRTA